MVTDGERIDNSLRTLAELLEIPDSHQQLAIDRYEALGKWLHRKESAVRQYDPMVYPQGSFRYGTVIRPLLVSDEYDLDLVCQLVLGKTAVTQQQVKGLVGVEIKAYAEANHFETPAQEKKRCWRLDYADHVKFHMDILPAIPEDAQVRELLVSLGVDRHIAELAVAITDRTHPNYTIVDRDWPYSNPKGYGRWFEGRMKLVTTARVKMLVEKRVYASIDEVPAFEWKTPLQRSIQILKRHRDVMFKDNPDGKPISMILTTLAGRSYEGQVDLADALIEIVDQMPTWVNDRRPRVPNPVHPGEDFADKWKSEPESEENFWLWHQQVQADLRTLAAGMDERQIRRHFANKYAVDLSEDKARELAARPGGSGQRPAPVVTIKTGQQPWSWNG